MSDSEPIDGSARDHPGAEARRLFDAQRQAQATVPPPNLEARLETLGKLRSLVIDNRAAIGRAISEDFGNRALQETDLLEIAPCLTAIRHARRHLARWMRPSRRPVALPFKPAKAWVQYQPLGCVGIIVPWNYPLYLALSPLTDAVAAGNRVLIKPSELTPTFSGLLKRLVSEAFPETEVAVVLGDARVADAFSRLPFDHLLFTGSTNIGRKVMQAAAENLTPVTLELGGKSPAIVCPGYATGKAAQAIALGKFLNAGQTCIAPDYVLAPKEVATALAEAIAETARKMFPRIADNPDYSSIVSDRHHQRLVDAIAIAKAAGARVLGDEAAGEGRKIPPTVVLDPPDESLLMREEIFGPVLPVRSYGSLDEAIAYVNAHDRPLALYCFSDDAAVRTRVLGETLSGGVTLNGTLLHISQDDLPFGGVGPSGMGAYHGHDGFKRFSHARSVFETGRVSGFQMLAPPYGRVTKLATKFLLRRG